MDTVIRGGMVVVPEGVERKDIAIGDGTIAAIEPEIPVASRAGNRPREIDARGLTIFPGLIDAHVHFNDPGRSDWEGIATGSAALAAGGGTCFVDMPLNSSPPTLDGPSFDAKLARCRAESRVDFALYGGLTPENLSHMEELAERGVVGFKAFMCPSGIEDFQWADDMTLYRGMEIAARLGLPVLVHAENASITAKLTEEARSVGRTDVRSFLDSRPAIAELEAIQRALLFAKETGCALHVVHVSTPEGVSLVRTAAASGVDATCETCPHYLLFTDQKMIDEGSRAKCAPPLRPEATRAGLVSALRSGLIDTVGSDHSPAPPEIKEREDFFDAWGGISGVQTTLRALLSLGIEPTEITRFVASGPAERFGLTGKGSIRVGHDADLVAVRTDVDSVLDRAELVDRHMLSPYVGERLTGAIELVLLRGEEIDESRRGRMVRRAARG